MGQCHTCRLGRFCGNCGVLSSYGAGVPGALLAAVKAYRDGATFSNISEGCDRVHVLAIVYRETFSILFRAYVLTVAACVVKIRFCFLCLLVRFHIPHAQIGRSCADKG